MPTPSTEAKNLSDYPQKFRDYIDKRHKECSDSNNADHQPTYQDEIDRITDECIKMFERGQAIIETMADAEHSQCRALFELQHGELARFRRDRYVQVGFKNYGIVLVPAYVSQLEAARFLQPFFTTPTLAE